jgi:Family of unknown function (DUF6470)
VNKLNLPQIRIESTSARIGLNIQKPKQELEQPRADLRIEQPRPQLEIEREPSKLMIDQTQAWEDMDLKHIFRRIEEFAKQGYEDWLEGLARVSRQGDELMKIENGGNPIADQAKENSESPIYEFNIGWIPSMFSVKVHYEPSKLHFRWNTQKAKIDVTPQKPIHQYVPGKVDVYLEQRNSLKIDFIHLFDEKA